MTRMPSDPRRDDDREAGRGEPYGDDGRGGSEGSATYDASRQPGYPDDRADGTQFTTALPRRRPPANPEDVPASYREPETPQEPAPFQETTVLRRPSAPPTSNVPGADRRARRDPLPPYTPPSYQQSYGAEVPDERSYGGPEGYDPAGRHDLAAGRDPGAPHDPASPLDPAAPRGLRRPPRKLTVTRVAALRSRELTHRGLEKFHGAVSADGADLSGLGHLTYAVMANYAVDAALAVALANTLFFAAATAESTGKVLLYLLLTVAPFAVIAPLVGPALDKLQHGRRIALAASSLGRTALAVVMAFNFDSWVIYPCALGMLVLSKGFGVLKAALAPRVLPPSITLVKTNSRLSVFGLIAGALSGGIAAGIAALVGSAGALWFTAVCGVIGAWLCLRIPAWVESTGGETPIRNTGAILRPGRKRGMPRNVIATLWSSASIRVSTGFLGLFVAFVIKIRYHAGADVEVGGAFIGASGEDQGWMQLLLLGAVGAAAGIGGFLGNALGAKLPLHAPQTVALWCQITVVASVIVAIILPGLITTSVVAFVASTASSLAKVCLDATIQQGLPESSRASAFGRIESVLQLGWVFGGVMGLLIGGVWALGGDAVFLAGFGILAVVLVLGLVQSIMVRQGRTLVPHFPPRKAGAAVAGAGSAGSGAATTGAAANSPRGSAPPRGAGEGSVRAAGAPRRAGPRYPSNATGTPRRTRKIGGTR